MSASQPPRPALRRAFRAFKLEPLIYFYTSNTEKFLHVQALLSRYGIPLRHFRSRTEPYPEDYTGSKEMLLRKAVQEVRERVGGAFIFFIEDTSVRIEALSSSTVDVPGLETKEWFAATSFSTLDKTLRGSGNDRRATVMSDIAVNLPGLDRAVLFHGETAGTIADEPPTFRGSAQHPWLTPTSFNGWFIPQDANKPLGAMGLEESFPHDFRLRCVVDLVDRLEEYYSALNLPQTSYREHHTTTLLPQLPLFDKRLAVIVVGRTCAGKTTLSEYLESEHEFQSVEASSLVRDEHARRGDGSDLTTFAYKWMDESGRDIVARTILDSYPEKLSGSFVISGFRTLEEVELFKREIPDVKIIHVEASDRTRYARFLERRRPGSSESSQLGFNEFVKESDRQWAFGLLRVAPDICDFSIINEEDIEGFHFQIDALVSDPANIRARGVRPARPPRRTELYRCLEALAEASRPLSSTEISNWVANDGSEVQPQNVNRTLKAVPELARRLEGGKVVRYAVTDSGRTFLRLVSQRIEHSENVAGTNRAV
jgi:inosine/xanthosine triphosphate pyrophosphatase family protein/dephospho-CoA kinase